MSGDKLMFDLSQEIEGSPNVFVRKDWLNILDNMNQNYTANQSVVDTSQLSNSNKYLDYRSSYFLLPLVLTLSNQTINATGNFQPATAATNADNAIGLKSWLGNLIHSMQVEYNGVTLVQLTPYANMWNSFKLVTSLSINDILTTGSTIGFYPDDASTWTYSVYDDLNANGQGVANNTNFVIPSNINNATTFNNYMSGLGNYGYQQRLKYTNFDPQGIPGGTTPYSTLLPVQSIQNLWKGNIYNKANINATCGLLQIAVTGIVYLKHLHSFFSMIPLLKGVFLKMTMNLNNCTTVVSVAGTNATPSVTTDLNLISTSVPVGGVCPLMISSAAQYNGFFNVRATSAVGTPINYIANLSVGGKCLNNSIANTVASPNAQSIYLYVPAMTFNPVFENAYLSSPVKQINYTDIYQYQVLNVGAGSQFNNLITNGIANLKSILILPYYSSAQGGAPGIGYNQLPVGVPVFQSPFDPAGCGPTSPLSLLTNFNVVVSGQNAIYNTIKYSFEQFNNQLYGCNAVNGGMTDGITSGLINSLSFEMEYCYYYVNISRMLPVEESVPKSVQIIGTNTSGVNLDLWIFLEYGCDVSIDLLTGSRV
jgi:hypothetical protein